ncbi:hypothetical protein K438DRAFT_1860371 [Mycena galopus ATCC 62051]|nr:hypothetical protein K438DRAFT_1860371 [Mycena galopus ATCC 62051]
MNGELYYNRGGEIWVTIIWKPWMPWKVWLGCNMNVESTSQQVTCVLQCWRRG